MSEEVEGPGFVRSDRGFKHYTPVVSDYGGHVRVYESSSAMHPSVWVAIECPANLNDDSATAEMVEAVAHLTIERAADLRDQLTHLIEHHYQVGGAI